MTTTWTNQSVLRLAAKGDPVAEIVARARSVVHQAREEGWSGPPFDPIELAQRLALNVVAREDVSDARTVPVAGSRARIEFNPLRPRGRVNYSVAHEIAHTLFPDFHECIRHRVSRPNMQGDEWQLEMLCNIAAAELLMPVGSFPDLRDAGLSIDRLMHLRSEFAVSAEAILIRVARLTRSPCAVFATSAIEHSGSIRYKIDYSIGSRSWPNRLTPGSFLPKHTTVANCTAIGFTSIGDEAWGRKRLHVEAVGIPPYPGGTLPRVVGIVTPIADVPKQFTAIRYVTGDCLQPHGSDSQIIAHVVNDSAYRWGGGFALAVKKKYPEVQEDFLNWVGRDRSKLKLGTSRLARAGHGLWVYSMVAQRGYGPSDIPRIRYQPLVECLRRLGEIALEMDASVHMPRIGCGQAGGDWKVVEELIDDALSVRAVQVSVYDLPSGGREAQGGLFT